MSVMYFIKILCLYEVHHMTFLDTLSYGWLIKKIASIVKLSCIKTNEFSVMLVTALKQYLMTLYHSSIVWLISLISW
jgi:hypothetical protein